MALSVDDLQQELDRLRGAAGGAATGVGQLGQALTGASGGLSSYSQILQGTSQALGGLVKDIPLAQAGLGGLSKGLGVSLDMTDRLNRVYMTLGSTGQSLGETQASLREQGDKFGLAIGLNEAAAQQFAKIMTANSKDLARLGGTAVMGSRRLGEAFEAMGPVRVALQNIGVSYEEQIEGLAAYTRMQTATGRAQQMSTQQLAQGAADYLRKLQDLAAVTGVSRQEQIKAQEAARAEQRFGAMLISEKRRADELERQGLSAQAAAVRKNIQELENFNGVVAGMDEEMAKGLRDMAAGAVNTPEARKAARTLGGDAQAIVAGLKQGTMTSAQALQRLGQATDRHVGRTVKLAQVSGSYADTFTDITKANKIAQLAQNDVAKRALETEATRKKAEQDRASDVAKTNITSNRMRQLQIEGGKALEGTQDAALAAADAIGTKLLEVLPTVVDKFNATSTSLTNVITSSQNLSEFLSGLGKVGAELVSPTAARAGGPTSSDEVKRSADALRQRLEQPTPAPRSAAPEPRPDVARLTADQIQALQPTSLRIDPAQVRELKPTAEPTARAAKIVADQLEDLTVPSLATPGFGGANRPIAMNDEQLRNQAANVTRRYMDMAGDAGLDKFRQSMSQAIPKSDNLGGNMPKIDLSRLLENATNQPDIMRVKMPAVSLPAAPTRQETADRTQQTEQNFRQMMDQINSRPQQDDMVPLLSIMNDMLNVQRQQSATMMKMLQAQRN
jgi:hypothetical protein